MSKSQSRPRRVDPRQHGRYGARTGHMPVPKVEEPKNES